MTRRRIDVLTIAILVTLCMSVSVLSSVAIADDNRLAHRLFKAEQFTEAAEFFSDPAWKGVAFFRSQQWWRAMESFSRAGDAESMYNLGNTYVQLGYWALALEAYQSTLSLSPDHADARHNMQIVKSILESDDESQSEAALAPKEKPISEVEEKNDDEGGQQSPDSTKHESDEEQSAPGDRDSTETTESKPKESRSARAENERQDGEKGDDSNPQGGDIRGRSDETAPRQDSGGGAENANPGEAGDADSSRTLDEGEQATVQWLNRIDDNPVRFMKRRIEIELARRKARGTDVESMAQPW